MIAKITKIGKPCRLADCDAGFFIFNNQLYVKTEYGTSEAYNSVGEVFWGGTSTKDARCELIVQPVEVKLNTDDEDDHR